MRRPVDGHAFPHLSAPNGFRSFLAAHFRTFLPQTPPHFPGHVFPRFSGHGCNEGEDVDSRVSLVPSSFSISAVTAFDDAARSVG
jgi:hypothetical protein